MPTKPRRNRRLARPGPGTSLKRRDAYYKQENERLRREGSPWCYALTASGCCYGLHAYVEGKNAKKTT